ncbi:MAG TPA: hypothetical protein VGQ53_07445 [Chitinophagaceae bacterium]|jgi:hypothetical protein|nr:hypothetical protein [Chitinophagaceae bacterium]
MKKSQKLFILLAIVVLMLSIIYFTPESKKEIKTEHFTFIFSKSIDRATISELANTLETNYSTIGADLKTQPASNIETNIYSQRWRYIKATGNWSASGNIEGTSKLHFVEQAWGESDSKKVAVHEFAHTVTLKLLLDNESQPINSKSFDKKFSSFPTWLWEAISVYEAKQFVDPKTLPYLNGHYPAISELNNRAKGGKIYSCGYTIIEYILSKYGKDNLINLVKNYGNLKSTFNIPDDQFCKDWYAFVKEKYLK